MKQLLTYGLLLLTILASPLIMSACQDDLPDTTEVMLTFTTRAFVSAEETGEKSDALSEESMENLRVIMLDGDNNVVGNAVKENIEKSSVVFKFQTPVTIGEEFKFLAIANENSLGLENELNAITANLSAYENNWKKRVIDASLNPTEEKPLPQTKFWTWTYGVDAEDSDKLNPTLDYIGCKISVQFVNHTTKPQSLSNIYIAGASKGYLFKQDDNDFVSDASANINLSPIDNLPATETSEFQHCYTYPKGNISSSPTLYATWNDVQYSLMLKDNQGNALTSLNRNDHLQIVVTLTDVGLDISYVIAEWVNNQPTYIGQSPSIGDDGYDIPEWGDGTDVNIGGGTGGGDEPVVPGDVIWSKELTPSVTLDWGVAPVGVVLDEKELSNFISGRFLGVVYSCSNNGQICIQRINSNAGHDSSDRNLPSQSSRIDVTSTKTYYEFVLSDDDINAIKNEGSGVGFWGGSNVTITHIYIKDASTQ